MHLLVFGLFVVVSAALVVSFVWAHAGPIRKRLHSWTFRDIGLAGLVTLASLVGVGVLGPFGVAPMTGRRSPADEDEEPDGDG